MARAFEKPIEQYQDTYAEFLHLQRRDGVLQATLHTNGGPFVLSRTAHTGLGAAWIDISRDPENKVVILTATGDEFATKLDGQSLLPLDTPAGFHLTYTHGRRLLENFLDIEVPVIAAINGPARNMTELPLLADIVLAAEHADFQDDIHFSRGVVPGDGMHVIWPELLGETRGRYFLLTQQRLSANEAHTLGVVNEVLPAEQLLARAWELAESLAQQPDLTLRYTKVALSRRIRRRLEDDLGYGLSLEALSVINTFTADPERSSASSVATTEDEG